MVGWGRWRVHVRSCACIRDCRCWKSELVTCGFVFFLFPYLFFLFLLVFSCLFFYFCFVFVTFVVLHLLFLQCCCCCFCIFVKTFCCRCKFFHVVVFLALQVLRHLLLFRVRRQRILFEFPSLSKRLFFFTVATCSLR